MNLKGKNALILGAGGSARSAVLALSMLGAQIRVTNRTKERALTLQKFFKNNICLYFQKCGSIGYQKSIKV